MKKGKSISLLALAFTLLSLASQAQISVGAKAGINVYDNYQTGVKYYASSPGLGFHVGGYGNYAFTEKLSARVEVLLSTRGLNLTESPTTGSGISYERQSIYIDIPTYATYNVWGKLNAEGGFVTSLFLDEYRSITKNQDGFWVEEGDQLRSYERLQFGLMAGATYEFTLFNQNFIGGLRYSMALTPALELVRDARAGRDPKYMMVQASIAYKIFDF